MKKFLLASLCLLSTTLWAANSAVIFGPNNSAQVIPNSGLLITQTNTPAGNPPAGFDQLYFKADNNLYRLTSAGVETMVGTAAGAGTVTSVALALPVSVFSISGSPVINTGTLTGSFITQTANTVFAGPAAAGPTAPTFRALVAADIPAIDFSKVTTGIVPILQGGSGQTTKTAAFNALSPLSTKGDVLAFDGTNNVPFVACPDGQLLGFDSSQVTGLNCFASGGGGGSGTVTTVSVVSANGLAGVVANPTTTAAITLSTTVNGIVKGNGTALSAAVSNTDYQAPISTSTAPANQFGTGFTAPNTFTYAQPSFANLSGSISAAQMLALPTNQIYVGNGSNQPTAVAMSGDASIVSSGALTVNSVGGASAANIGLVVGAGVVPISHGGTGQVTQTAAFNALSPLTAKGDLIGYDGASNVSFPVGTDGFVLSADSTQTSGLKWISPGTPVTSVTATAPLASSGGTTPDISLTGIILTANGGTNHGNYTAGSVIFAGAGGTSLTEANADFFWDDTLKTLFLGARTLPPGDIGEQIVKAVSDPANNFMGLSSDMTGTFTADSVTTMVGVNNVVRTKVDTGFALHGAALNNISLMGRQDAADLGTVDLAGGYFAQFVQGNGAKSTGQYSAYLAGFHSLDATGTVGAIYDFQALPSTIPAGVVTDRYGIYLAPDTNYTKKNWLSGFSRIGGSSFVAPTHALEVPGEVSQSEALTDSGGAGLIFNESSHTTVTGSNTTVGLQGVATATVDVGAVNDKTVAAVLGTTTRGDGTDDGNLHEMDGAYALMFHNSGAAGTTDKVITLGSTFIHQQGTVTDLYDVKPESVPAGGTVTNHYGVYIEQSPFGLTKKNWISGATFMGSGGFSSPVEALELSGNLKMSGNILDSASTPTINVTNRQLTYGGGVPSVDWLNDVLYDATSVASIDWGNRFLIDNTGAVNLDYSTNGTIQVHAAIDMNSNLIHNVTDPAAAQDAATKNYVDTASPSESVTTQTANYTILVTDQDLLGDSSGGTFTFTLPTSAASFSGGRSKVFTIMKVDSSANVISISAQGADTIQGVATVSLNTQYQSVTIITDGTGAFYVK